ncbi:acetylornithine aminotransferase [Meredithblackwellia eburnea MCA 4105]
MLRTTSTTLSKRIISSAAIRCYSASASASSSPAKANTDYLTPTHLDDSPSPQVSARLDKYAKVTLNTYARPPFILTRGKKCSLWDTDGREYLDFSGGIAVNALGHADDGVQAVISDQSALLVHNSNLWHNEWSGELALLLVDKTKELGGLGYPAPSQDTTTTTATPASSHPSTSSGLKVFFSNSGTEANEGALKFARKWGKINQATQAQDNSSDKVEIVSFKDGFHGRSMGALSATWQSKYQAPFAPLVPAFVEATLNDVEAIKDKITDKTCGVIVEPIQGEGGILEASEPFLRALRKRCDEVGALLIFDEIQCGLGRTGSLWAHGSLPVDCHPDVVTMAKPLANGVPIGAILMKDKVANIIKIGDHGTTFGGGPLQTRVAHHVLTRLTEPSFLPTVTSLGTTLKDHLATLPALFPRLISGPPRGRGLILGLPFARDEYAARVMKLARERGLLLLTCGKATVRFVPSLVVTEKEIEKAVDILESCLVVLNREAEGL